MKYNSFVLASQTIRIVFVRDRKIAQNILPSLRLFVRTSTVRVHLFLFFCGGHRVAGIGKFFHEYAVYFYKNHERIKLGENGGMRFASKTGYINEYKVALDDVKAGDIIYAVEVPLNAEIGSMNIRKSISIVVTENE